MHIMFSVPRYHPNHNGLVQGLLERGHKITFAVLSQGKAEYHYPGTEIFQIRKISPLKFLFKKIRTRTRSTIPNVFSLYRFVSRARPNLIVVRGVSITSIVVTLIARIQKISCIYYDQIPLGQTVSGDPYPKLRALRLLPQFRMTTVALREQMKTPLRQSEFFVPFAVETPDRAFNRAYNDQPPCRILSVAKLDHPRKNSKLLVEALTPALREGRARLTIVGTLKHPDQPAYKDLLNFIKDAGVSDHVRIIPNLPYLDCRALYFDHDLFILASSSEPAAISPFEAMAAGIAVICSTENGTNYIINPSENGFIFKAVDLQDLRNFSERLINAPEEIKRMGQRAANTMRTEFSPGYVADLFLERMKAATGN